LFLIISPVFFCCIYVASTPIRDGRATLAQGLFWIALVPVLIWFILVFGLFGFAHILGIRGVI